ncbi:MAG: HAD family hydrolase [Bacillota bacterium]
MGKFKAVCFDMDGTLIINTNSVRFLCCLNNKMEEVMEIEKKVESGQMSLTEGDYLKSRLIEGLEIKKVKEEFDKYVELIDGIGEVTTLLHSQGLMTVLITTGPVQVAEVLEDRFGFDAVYGSRYAILDGKYSGAITEHLGPDGKLKALELFCRERKIRVKDCIAVGDGYSDLSIFRACGKSIAINYEDSILGKADEHINTNNIKNITGFFEL